MVGQFRIKRADSPEEVGYAARVVASAIRESYGELVSAEVVNHLASDHCLDARVEQWWQATVDGAHLWLAQRVDDGQAVAMAYADTSTDPSVPTPLELRMLFVLEEAKGSGLADELLQTALGEAPAFLWTLVGNDRAVGFHHKHGFALDGATRQADHLVRGRDDVKVPIEVRLTRLS